MLSYIKRQENESEEHYNLFLQYLFAKENRSIENLSLESGVSTRQLYRIAKKHNWKSRLTTSTHLENQRLKAEFAQNQKEKLQEKLDLLNSTDNKIMEIRTMMLYKGDEFLAKNLDPEKYIKRANQYLSLQLKIQKFEQNFATQIENYDINENIELDDLKDQIEKEMRNEKHNENNNIINIDQAENNKETNIQFSEISENTKGETKANSHPANSQDADYSKLKQDSSVLEDETAKNKSPNISAIYCHKPKSKDPEINAVLDRLE